MDLVLHVNGSAATSTSPTMRIARFVSTAFDIPLVHDEFSAVRHLETPVDNLFVKHGMLKFSDHREESLELYRKAKRVINLENDYTFVPDSRFCAIREDEIKWSTCEYHEPGHSYVNWNVLTFLPLEAWLAPADFVQPVEHALFYYGAFREGRLESFNRFFKESRVPIVVSSYRGGKRFQAINPQRIDTTHAFKDPHFIQKFPMTLYIEDEHSHHHFTSPANRFYECLQLGVAMLFDVKTQGSLARAGIDVSDYTVRDHRDVELRFAQWDTIRRQQRVRWWSNYIADLNSQVHDARRLL